MNFYPPKIDARFHDPQNAGEIEAPTAVGRGGSFVCGAALKIFLRVADGKIVEAKYKAAGCGFLLAAADALCESIRNKEFAEIGKNLRESETAHGFFEDMFENEFPAARRHCLELSLEALRAGIDDYRTAQLESWQGDEALICTCFGVSEKTIETAIVSGGLTTIEEVTDNCRAGGGCGSCQPLILDILEDIWRGEI